MKMSKRNEENSQKKMGAEIGASTCDTGHVEQVILLQQELEIVNNANMGNIHFQLDILISESLEGQDGSAEGRAGS